MKLSLKRYLNIVGVSVVSIAAMLILASFKTPPQRKPPTDNRPTISVVEVKNEAIRISVPVIGKLKAHDRVDVFSEVSGVLESSGKEFLSGQIYRAGEVMLKLNQEETELNLKAQRSGLMTNIAGLLPDLKFDYPESYIRWNNYLQSYDIDSETKPLPKAINEREKLYVSSKGIYNTYYQIKSQETRLEKYTIRAPFDGMLIQHNITPGNLVRSGQSLGLFINPTSFDLETSVGLDEVSHIQVGDKVNLASNTVSGSWTGRVSRIVRGLDQNSQMVKVFVSVAGETLREQMFLSGEILTSTYINGIELPRKMLRNGTTVLEFVDGSISYRDADIVSTRGEIAIIQGLEDGSLISKQTTNLLNGSQVRVPGLNDLQPEPQKASQASGKNS